MKTKHAILLAVALIPAASLRADNASQAAEQLKKFPTYQTGYLDKEASLKSFELPEGYELELVLSEPQIKEPVAIAWDGNGVMYVAEMRTYMQDADAKGEQTPVSRISRHEDTNGDGTYDKHSTFIDNLLLPRMILPLDDRIIVGITNTLDLWTYRDTNNDGVADEKIKIYEGGKRGGNMEHQPSGLIWGLDNWIYLTYEATRYRYTDGKLIAEKLPRGNGQWGLTQDDDGRNYFAIAGREVASTGFQQPSQYGLLRLQNELPASFQEIFPIATVPDVQGGPRRVGKNGAINHFTGVAGPEIFRGDNLPADLYGDLIIPEPVGRFIRRAKVNRSNGKTTLTNATPGTEFIRTRDVNFRPVQSVTGPDGCLYIVDMHRGIIQQGNWTRPGSYLREVINGAGLDKNTSHGRIYRLVHKNHTPGKKPNLSSQKTIDLVQHLAHKNSWWRDTAKKLIILRKDRQSAVSALQKLALDKQQTTQTRIAALWALEGCSAVSEQLLGTLLADPTPRLQPQAIRVAEAFVKQNNTHIINALTKLGSSTDPEVAVQLLNSIRYCGNPSELTAATDAIFKQHGHLEVIAAINKDAAKRNAEEARFQQARRANNRLASTMAKGKATYQQICFACHGADGKGQPLAGQAGHFLAPSFIGSPRVLGNGEAVILALLHGVEGPIDGKTYDGLMPAQANNSDQWIADVTTYIRNSFGNKAPAITTQKVATVRKKHSGRKKAWTQTELNKIEPVQLTNRKKWKLTASHNNSGCSTAIDGDLKSRYTTNAVMSPGMWFQIELPKASQLSGIKLNTLGSNNDYPRGYKVECSIDGKSWKAVAKGKGNGHLTDISFTATPSRFIKITQTERTKGNYWSIHELSIFGTPSH
ncbi:MAG: discoidin domain-containing protein [Akkermansiaceae bacterium]|tara:strand:+ start:1973 stop:4582 length:2610 start_codon:yes stop_codon:yes gene_type:complete